MTKVFFTTLLLLSLTTTTQAQQYNCLGGIHIGFVYPLSTNGKLAGQYTNNCSFHALAGVSYAEQAFCASGISNIVHHDANGFAGAGICNIIGGNTQGVQCAGVVNVSRGNLRGVQAAGVTNVLKDSLEGVQAAGINNVARDVQGVQAAGIHNLARNVEGMQVAGLANTAQAADMQVAGLINTSKTTVDVQVAGLINVAHKVKGAQIAGLINIAESCEYPIGLINIIKNGEKAIGWSLDDKGTQMISLRSGSHKLYGILGVGGNYNGEGLLALEGGIGLRTPLAFFFRLNMELAYMTMTDFQHGSYQQSTFRLFPSLKLGRHLELYGGPTFAFISRDNTLRDAPESKYVWSQEVQDQLHGVNIGFMGGVQWYF
jgi:hypothetical protein